MSNHRASLLTGLRTGGPRSVSNGAYNNLPQTAAIGGQFPQHAVQFPSVYGYERDDTTFPMTAPAKDMSFAQMQHQQQTQLLLLQAQAVQNAVMGGHGNGNYGITPEQQAFQLQYEMYKMQALQQQQQLQAQLLAQAQMQMQQSQMPPPRRRPSEPITASPYTTSFPATRTRTVSTINDGPMTAALDGRFGGGKPSSSLNPNASTFQLGGTEPVASVVSTNWRSSSLSQPPNSATTGVISGGTLLGATVAPSAKHNTAASWRRPSVAKETNHGASRTPSPDGSFSASPPTVYVSTPEETSPTQSRSVSPPTHRVRPQPLHFNIPITIPDENEFDGLEGQVLPISPRFETPSSPSTPSSGGSSQSAAREEASRRLYEGLGIGRPAPQQQVQPHSASVEVRVGAQPSRQPRGPPSGVEDLGARNFAARIRRKAIGGLETLMDARNRRASMVEMVEVY